jgi:hypothetical protein
MDWKTDSRKDQERLTEQAKRMLEVARQTPEYVTWDEFHDLADMVPSRVKLHLIHAAAEEVRGETVNRLSSVEARNVYRRGFINAVVGKQALEKLDSLDESEDKNRRLRALVTAENILTGVQVAEVNSDYNKGQEQFNRDIQKRIQATVADEDGLPGRQHSNKHVRFTSQSLIDAIDIITTPEV